MRPKIAARPTVYRSVQFRSRLEAKWAAFFDELGWPWQYEPYDLDNYIPDFILPFEHNGKSAPVLVEVKPETHLKDLEVHKVKPVASGWTHEILLVGTGVFVTKDLPHPDFTFGLLGEVHLENPEAWVWGEAILMRCEICKRASFRHEACSFVCRVSGCYDGDDHLGHLGGVEAMWGSACATVQWRGPGKEPTFVG